jgi:hypothetical protein
MQRRPGGASARISACMHHARTYVAQLTSRHLPAQGLKDIIMALTPARRSPADGAAKPRETGRAGKGKDGDMHALALSAEQYI